MAQIDPSRQVSMVAVPVQRSTVKILVGPKAPKYNAIIPRPRFLEGNKSTSEQNVKLIWVFC